MSEWWLEILCWGPLCLPRAATIATLVLGMVILRVVAEASLRQVARDVAAADHARQEAGR